MNLIPIQRSLASEVKIPLKDLRRLVRESLLTEAAKAVADLPPDAYVTIEKQAQGFEVFYSNKEGRARYGIRRNNRNPVSPYNYRPEDLGAGGFVIAVTPPGDGPRCGGAYVIALTSADRGWGPLIYDVAMEYASMTAGGLAPDRITVSEKARVIWQYYMNKRGDVIPHQLDDTFNSLTPEDDDNCEQTSPKAATTANWKGQERWEFSPLSKRYTKKPDVINQLKSMGKLIMK